MQLIAICLFVGLLYTFPSDSDKKIFSLSEGEGQRWTKGGGGGYIVHCCFPNVPSVFPRYNVWQLDTPVKTPNRQGGFHFVVGTHLRRRRPKCLWCWRCKMRGVTSDGCCDNGVFVAVPFTSTGKKMHLNKVIC